MNNMTCDADISALEYSDPPLRGYLKFASCRAYLGWLVFAGLVLATRPFTANDMEVDVFTLVMVTLVAVVHIIRGLFIRRDVLSPDMLFVGFYYMFHFGVLILLPFNLVPTRLEKETVPFQTVLGPATWFCALCMIMFLLGYEIRGRKEKIVPMPRMYPISSPPVLIAQILFLLAIGMMLFDVVRSRGDILSVAYENDQFTEGLDIYRFWGMGKVIANIAIFLYVAASLHHSNKVFKGYFIPILVLIFFVLMFMSGKRGTFILMFLPPLFLYHYFKKRIRAIWLLLALLAFAAISPALAYMRAEQSYSIDNLAEGIQASENPLLQTVAEMGGSFKTVNAVMFYHQGNADLWYGKSYIGGLPTLVPYLDGVFSQITNTNFSAGLYITLRHQGGGAGMGASIAMEAFLNFGWLGMLVLFLVGYLYRRLFESAIAIPTFARTVFYCAAALMLVRWIRGDLVLVFRSLVWTWAAGWLLQKLGGGQVPAFEPQPVLVETGVATAQTA